MDTVNKYVIVKAILLDGKLISIWDERVSYENHEDYGQGLNVKGNHKFVTNLVDCIYDIETKELSSGINVDIYPKTTNFIEGEVVLVEGKYRHLGEFQIRKIVYEAFDTDIRIGFDIEDYQLKQFPDDLEVHFKTIYCIRNWKPYYILNDGRKIKWEHELYHKEVRDDTPTLR